MAKVPNQSDEAVDTVFDNLQLDQNELGIGNADDFDAGDDQQLAGADDAGLSEGDEGIGEFIQDDADKQGQQQLDDLRVTHTQQRKPFPKSSEVKSDKQGNLVDKTGKIVAKKGAEARLYQNLHKTRGELEGERTRIQDLSGRLTKAVDIAKRLYQQNETYRGVTESLKEFGFTPKDQLDAMQLYADLRANTKETLTRLLTRAAANGITLEQFSGGVDPKSIIDVVRSEIEKRTKPFEDHQKTLQEREESERKAKEELNAINLEVNEFFQRNPDALPDLPVFAKVLSDPRFNRMTLPEIWLNIKLHRLQKPRTSRTPNRGSLPNGRRSPPNAGTNLAPVSDSYDSIITGVLEASGIK